MNVDLVYHCPNYGVLVELSAILWSTSLNFNIFIFLIFKLFTWETLRFLIQ